MIREMIEAQERMMFSPQAAFSDESKADAFQRGKMMCERATCGTVIG